MKRDHPHHGVVVLLLAALTASACPEDRTVLTTCTSDSQCPSGFCVGECLDANGDVDGDGLTNRLEREWGSDLFLTDTDGDGKDDQAEFGSFPAAGTSPPDADGDGIYDFEESSTDDADGDCLADELDDASAQAEAFAAYVDATCGVTDTGVCAGRLPDITFHCTESGSELVLDAPACTFGDIPDYASDDGCDGLDNDCDAQTDEDCVPAVACGDLAPQDLSQTLFVATRGTPTGDGSPQSPYPTVSAALNGGNADGKTIVVGEGTYDETATFSAGAVTIVGGYEGCHFAGPGADTVLLGVGTEPALTVDGTASVTLSALRLEAPTAALRLAGTPSVTADALVVATSAGTAVEVAGGQLSLINAVLDASSSAPPLSEHIAAAWVHDGGRITAFNSLLRAQGDADLLGAVYAEDSANTFLVNTLLAVGAGTASTAAGIVSLAASAQPVLHHCDFTLPGGVPVVVHADTAQSIALLTDIGAGVANLALGCAPTGPPWELGPASPCIDRGADPTQAPYGIGYAPHMVDRQGDPRRADPEGGNGFWDIGPDEVGPRTCMNAGDCVSQDAQACLATVCTPAGLCAHPLDALGNDLDGDGTCDSFDLDTDGDGIAVGADCDDTDVMVGAGVDDDADGVCDAVDACPLSGPGLVDADFDGCFDAEDCDDSDPTVNPGATEVCGDGVDNDCVGGVPEGALFVDPKATVNGDGSSGTPFDNLQDAIDAAVADGEDTRIIVGAGDLVGPFVVSLTDGTTEQLWGGRDPACDWEPAPSATTLTSDTSPALTLGGSAWFDVRDFNVAIGAAGASLATTTAVLVAATGEHTIARLTATTPGATSETVVVDVAAGASTRFVDLNVQAAAAPTATGVRCQGAECDFERATVEVASNGPDARGLEIGTLVDVDNVFDSVIRVQNPAGNAVGLTRPDAGAMVMANSVIAVEGLTSTGLASVGPVAVIGSAIRSGAGPAATLDSALSGAEHLVANTIIGDGQAHPGVVFTNQGQGGRLTLLHNAFAASPALNVDGADLVGQDAIATCAAGPCNDPTSTGNTLAACGFDFATLALSDASPCAEAGTPVQAAWSPAGPTEPLFRDLFGAPRPGDDGSWSIGPIAVALATPCADTDGDGRCDSADQCPNGHDGTTGEDVDLDGCWTPSEDCDDSSATTYVGAPEQCDGVDNDCSHDGIDFAPDTGVLYVQQGQSGDGLSPASPLGAINDALAVADGDPSITHILVAPGTYDEPILFSNAALTNIDVLTLQGSADPTCGWEPGTAPTTVVRNEPRVLDIESDATSLTFRDLRLEPLNGGLDNYEVVYMRNGDTGARVFEHVELQTPAAAVGAGSIATGFWIVGNGVVLDLSNVDIALGAAGSVTGVFVNQNAQVTADRIRVELDGSAAAGSVRGLDLGATGTDVVTNSLVLATGDSGFSNWAINKGEGGDLVVVNTVVQGFAGSGPTGIRYVSDAGSLLAFGCSVTVGPGGNAFVAQSNVPAQSAIIGCIANGPNQALYAGMNNGATLLLAYNALFTQNTTVIGAPQAGAVTESDINTCVWNGCDPDTTANIVAECPLDPNYQLPSGSPCDGFGVSPADVGLSLPFMDIDRDGDPRPGVDGTWDIGPDEAD